jgi:hypothetical protein
MAQAPGHKLGQTIGNYCEAAVEILLKEVAEKHGLFLDKKGSRPARKKTRKLRWLDKYGSSHDLDYVLERGGSPEKIGAPVAFIESAWRRYTKHSKAKAQEIQGAILPIAERHSFSAPFLGCVLVGEYTDNAIKQLQRLGFHTLHFPLNTVVKACQSVGVDWSFDENTPDKEIAKKQRQWQRLSSKTKAKVWQKLLELNEDSVKEFKDALEAAIMRHIVHVSIIPLHGQRNEFDNLSQAIQFLNRYEESRTADPLVKYEVQIRYDNGDKIDAEFQDKTRAVKFLQAYQSDNWVPAVEELAESVETEADAGQEQS